MTFIPSEKPPRKPRWDLTPEEWRLLMITFAGGVGSIVVGAATIGIAFALVRFLQPGRGLIGRLQLVAFTLVLCLSTVQGYRKRRSFNRFYWIVWTLLALNALAFVLMWIGIAGGVH